MKSTVIGLSLFVVALAGLSMFIPSAPNESSKTQLAWAHGVERIVWAPDTPLDHFFSGRSESDASVPLRPRVLTNTIADRWLARQSWSPAYIQQRVRTLTNVRSSKSSAKFLYYDEKHALNADWQPGYDTEHVPTQRFFSVLEKGPGYANGSSFQIATPVSNPLVFGQALLL